MILTVPKKRCECCGVEKPLSEFYKQSYTEKFLNICKQCTNIKRSVEHNRIRHSKFVSKEKIRELDKNIEYPREDWRDAMIHFSRSCAFCGKPEGRAKVDRMDFDHLVPISKGGKTVRENVIPACRTCNRGRGARDWRDWFRKQPFYSVERERRIDAWTLQSSAKSN